MKEKFEGTREFLIQKIRVLICPLKVDNVNFQDFGISSGKRRVCTYNGSQQTCGGDQTAGGTLIRYFDDKGSKRITRPLDGKSINSQRAETLETNTGFIRGSFVSCIFFT